MSFVFAKDVIRICLRKKQEDSFRKSFQFICPSHRQFIHDSINLVDELAPNNHYSAICWVFKVHKRIHHSIETVIFFQVHARIGVILIEKDLFYTKVCSLGTVQYSTVQYRTGQYSTVVFQLPTKMTLLIRGAAM